MGYLKKEFLGLMVIINFFFNMDINFSIYGGKDFGIIVNRVIF